MKAGAERIFCSTICMSAVYWLSIRPENMPGALGEERRQADAEGRIGEPVEAPLGQDAHHGHGRAKRIERQAHGRALEVGAR